MHTHTGTWPVFPGIFLWQFLGLPQMPYPILTSARLKLEKVSPNLGSPSPEEEGEGEICSVFSACLALSWALPCLLSDLISPVTL